MALPRFVAIMGSGETSPTMRAVHRRLMDAVGGGRAVVLDTPFGFQTNAEELAAKAVDYFEKSVLRPATVASLRSSGDVGSLSYEECLRDIEGASYVFAGPGSPTYAMNVWGPTPIPGLLEKKLVSGGCVTFASAAALTLGVATVPVYEIYKAGAPVGWAEGMNLLQCARLSVAVVPHYNNMEGGTHDTRYCYMGEERMRTLESLLPEGAHILGIDEHTAAVIDLDADVVAVEGVGDLIVRRAGIEERLPAGSTLPLERIRGGGGGGQPAPPFGPVGGAEQAASPFSATVDALAASFDSASGKADLGAAVNALLRLDELLWEWSHETFGTDEMERARRQFRAMLARCAELQASEKSRLRVLAPLVDALLEARARARKEERWDDADALRAALTSSGIEVHDTDARTEWSLGEPRNE